MRGTSLKITGLGVLAALAAAPSAHAALAGGTPFDANNGPDLRSAEVLSNPATFGPKDVRYCFDIPVNEATANAGDFGLRGYDEDEFVTAVDVFPTSGDGSCVRVRFAAEVFSGGNDIAGYTVGAIGPNAIVGAPTGSQTWALADATALEGSTQGGEAGNSSNAELVSADIDTDDNSIVFSFDRRLFIPINTYFYVDDEGNVVFSDSVTFEGDGRDVVRATFPDNGGTQTVADAVRAGSIIGGVDQSSSNDVSVPLHTVAVTGTDGQTSRPDIVNVQRSGTNTVDITFDGDQPVKIDDPTDFYVVEQNGALEWSTNAVVLQLSGNSRVVRVTFNEDLDDFVAAGALPGAVLSNGTVTGVPNTLGSGAIGAIGNAVGFTDAPDAQRIILDQDAATVTVEFDEDIYDVDEDDFHARGVNGNFIVTTAGQGRPVGIQIVDGNAVVLQFESGGQVAATKGIDIDEDAVEDALGNDSIQQIIGKSSAAAVPPVNPFTPAPSSNSGNGGGGNAPAPAPAAQQVAGQSGAAPTARVSPARSGSSAKARVLYAKYRKGSLTTKVSGKAKTVKIRITLRGAKGKTVKTVTRTIRTNRQVTLKNLTRSSKVKSVRVRVL